MSSWRLIAAAIGVLLVAIVIVYRWRGSERSAEITSLAVLPFKSLRATDDDNKALGLGLANTLITKLSNIGQLTVPSTNAVLNYNSQEQDPLSAGRRLGVGAVLDGNFQRDGERIRVMGWVYFALGRKAEKTAPASIKSIAVLPFKPLNHSQDDEYLGIGLADSVITRLSGSGKIIVRSTGSVSKYTASTQDPLAAGREQKVDAVMDASFWRSGEKIRVTARLLRLQDGMPIWSFQCDEFCTDTFAVQTLISERVAGALMPQLTGAERARLTKHYTENREANQLYTLGRFYWNKRTEEGLKKGIDCFQRSIDKDPNYALAYAGLAECYVTLEGSTRKPLPN